MTTRIKWKRSQEGYVDSHCGRFEISPLYFSCVNPRSFKVEYVDGGERIVIASSKDSQRDAKRAAQIWLDERENPNPSQESKVDWDQLL